MIDVCFLYGCIFILLGWWCGYVYFDLYVCQLQVDDYSGVDDLQLLVILFGFIDLYVYGVVGVDLMQGGDVVCIIVCIYLCFGIIILLVIIMIVGLDEIEYVLQGVVVVMVVFDVDVVSIVGVYLEGLFISLQCLGVQFNCMIEVMLVLVQ